MLLNPWALSQYAHTMIGSVQTGCFVMACIGAFYLLGRRYEKYGKLFVRTEVIVGVMAAVCSFVPPATGRGQWSPDTSHGARRHGGTVPTQQGAPIVILGQPDLSKRTLDNPLMVPRALSFLTYALDRAG